MNPTGDADALTQAMILGERIHTPRVTLEAMRGSWAPALFAIIDGDREHLGRTMAWVATIQALDDQVSRVEVAEAARVAGTAYPFVLIEAQTGALMGAIGVHPVDRGERRCELGYWVTSAFEGRGYVSEALEALVGACFQVGLERVQIRCSSRNHRSRRLAQRCGFHLEARREGAGEHSEGASDQLVFVRRSEPDL